MREYKHAVYSSDSDEVTAFCQMYSSRFCYKGLKVPPRAKLPAEQEQIDGEDDGDLLCALQRASTRV